jgi:dTDP-4-dehydrorhamnose 3,5-epimerase-like enzyme
MGKGEIRGNHAHKALKQLFVVLSGEIKLDLNFQSKLQPISVVLKENQGVILEPMTWRVFECLSESARIFVAANEEFDEMDYVRNLDVFNGKQI